MDDSGKKVDIVSTGSLNAKSGKSDNSEKININGGEITLTGTTKITLKVGSSKNVLSNTGVDISGTQVNVKANAMAWVKGAVVNVTFARDFRTLSPWFTDCTYQGFSSS